MRILAAVLCILGLSGPAVAGDPPTPFQEVQMVQSALAILGYEPGPLDGEWGNATQSALEAFAADTGYDGPTGAADGAVIDALFARLGPALEAGFGTDPTGTWDLDFSAYSEAERRDMMALYGWEVMETCSSPLAIYFSGIAYRQWVSGAPLVMTLKDRRLEALHPDPGDGFLEPFAFSFVDESTMHREVEGDTEIWLRCDGPQ
ncbi:MAG: peptidoglycan-binding protein [Alphaproteobacteria bacterium]